MEFFRELSPNEYKRCVVVKYHISTDKNFGNLKDACWALAIGQSVGNPNIRNKWETNYLFEMSSCVIYGDEDELSQRYEGEVI